MTYGTNQPGNRQSLQIGVVLSDAMRIMTSEPAKYFGISAIAAIPSLIEYALAGLLDDPDSSGIHVVVQIVAFILGSLISAVITYGAVATLRGNPFDVSNALSYCLNRLGPMLLLSIVMIVSLIGGMLLLIVPGIILMCIWYVAIPACVVEQTGVIDSLKRSQFLTAGNRLKILILFAMFALFVAIYMAIMIQYARNGGGIGMVVINLLFTTVFACFSAAVSAAAYFRLRTAKDGVSVEKLSKVFE